MEKAAAAVQDPEGLGTPIARLHRLANARLKKLVDPLAPILGPGWALLGSARTDSRRLPAKELQDQTTKIRDSARKVGIFANQVRTIEGDLEDSP